MKSNLDLIELAYSQYPAEMTAYAAALACKIPLPFAAGFWISKPAGRELIHRACFAQANDQLIAAGKERETWEAFIREWPAGRRCHRCKEEIILPPFQ